MQKVLASVLIPSKGIRIEYLRDHSFPQFPVLCKHWDGVKRSDTLLTKKYTEDCLRAFRAQAGTQVVIH